MAEVEEPCQWCGAPRQPCKCVERMNCTEIGKAGHFYCGYCFRHNMPRYLCGHKISLLNEKATYVAELKGIKGHRP